jgi:hypothetical protein
MPRRIAPAWPVVPPPSTVTFISNLSVTLGQLERLAHDHACRFATEEHVERTLIDGDIATARCAEDASGGGLATAGAVVLLNCHELCPVALDVQRLRLLGGVRMLGAGL